MSPVRGGRCVGFALRAELAVQVVDQLEQADLAAGGDVEHAAGDAFGLGGEHVAVDDVGDESEIARLFAVAENAGRLALQNGGDEFRNDGGVFAVGILAGAEHVEVAQGDGFDGAHRGEGLAVLFAGQFGDAVGGDRGGQIGFAFR